MKLLITSAHSRKCFDIYNILKSKLEHKDICLSSDLGFIKRSLLSVIYFKKVFKTEKILQLIKTKNFSIKILPVEEIDIELIYNFDLKDASALPDEDVFFRVVNKRLLFEYANKKKIPCPQTIQGSELDLNAINGKVVVKPIRGMGSEGVRFFENYTTASLYLKSLSETNNFLIQELIGKNNVRAGCFLFSNGDLISYYGHERLRTYPELGGVTINSISHDDMRIMDLGKQLLGPLNWTGLAMIEFMWSDSLKDYQLIEVNPRAWGSIMLSEKCESHLLMNYVNIIFGQSVTESIGKKNCSIRWLVPFDIINLVKGKVSIIDYTSIDRKIDCLINISYSNFFQSVLFHIFQFTQLTKIFKRFFLNG